MTNKPHLTRSFAALAVTLCLLLLTPWTASADLRLPSLLGDGVILQRDATVVLWGWARDGEKVEVTLDGQVVATTRAAGGSWRVELAPRAAGGPHRFEFRGDNVVVVDDAWFGDVWLASGQSNMERTLRSTPDLYAADIAAADLPMVRQFKVPKRMEFAAPLDDVVSDGWIAASPESVLDFSAAGFFFARALNERYEVPIGIVNASFGGSRAQCWLSADELAAWPDDLATAQQLADPAYLQGLQLADQQRQDRWYADVAARDAGLLAEPPWSSARVDTSDWAEALVPAPWDESPVGPVNGVVWFRSSVELPESVSGQGGILQLGRMIDADTTWVNGVEVAVTTYQYPERRYEVPPDLLHAGRNEIAVRLVSTFGIGGFVRDKPYRLRVGELEIDLRRAWRYRVGAVAEPLAPPAYQEWMQPLGCYNGMLAPLQPMRIKGVIWYQGESNVAQADDYLRAFTTVIRSWRRQWGQGDFPFLYVQLANFLRAAAEPGDSGTASLREAQRLALAEPNTAMAVAIDVGEWNDIHPADKRSVGERLALGARHLAYGEADLEYSGPLPASAQAADGRVVIRFDHAGSGLEARNGPLRGFALAGDDGGWTWAWARVEGDRVIAWSESVPQPRQLRYAWADNPAGANLYNREGLPASPFELPVEPEGAVNEP